MGEKEINAAVHPSPGGGFWCDIEGMPGCITQAEKYSAAIERLHDAHRAWQCAPEPVSPSEANSPPLGEVPASAGRVAAWLVAAGWSCTKEGEQHFVFVKTAPGARVTVPKTGHEALNEGYRAALAKAVGA